jgi:hypothetical protein
MQFSTRSLSVVVLEMLHELRTETLHHVGTHVRELSSGMAHAAPGDVGCFGACSVDRGEFGPTDRKWLHVGHERGRGHGRGRGLGLGLVLVLVPASLRRPTTMCSLELQIREPAFGSARGERSAWRVQCFAALSPCTVAQYKYTVHSMSICHRGFSHLTWTNSGSLRQTQQVLYETGLPVAFLRELSWWQGPTPTCREMQCRDKLGPSLSNSIVIRREAPPNHPQSMQLQGLARRTHQRPTKSDSHVYDFTHPRNV